MRPQSDETQLERQPSTATISDSPRVTLFGRGHSVRLDIYVKYRGNCEQAFRFYEEHLGGNITGMVRHGEQPNPNIPADWKEKVLHARIEIGGTVLMGADIPQAEPTRSAYLTLTLDREADAERVADAEREAGRWKAATPAAQES